MIKTPTVLHSIDTGSPGGAETVFLSLANAQDELGIRSIAIAKSGGWVEAQLRQSNIKSYFADPAGKYNWAYLRKLVEVIRENNVDLICSHLFGSNLYCALASMASSKPSISVFHGAHDLAPLQRFRTAKRVIVQSGSAAIVAVSGNLRKELISFGFRDVETLQTIYNGVDMTRFRPQPSCTFRDGLSISASDILVGAVGNFRPAKAYHVLADAAKILAERDGRYRFLIAGEGNNEIEMKLRDQLSKANLGDVFHFLGFVKETEQLYNNLDIYVSSSSSEGFSISCIEAMACGIPVVATRSGGPEEIIVHGESGLLVNTGDPEAIANAIESVLRDPVLSESLSRNGILRAKEYFGEVQTLHSYRALFNSILARSDM